LVPAGIHRYEIIVVSLQGVRWEVSPIDRMYKAWYIIGVNSLPVIKEKHDQTFKEHRRFQ